MSFRSRVQRKRVTLDCSNLPSMTEQSHKESCDINVILRNALSQGQLPDMIKSNPQYGDFSTLPTYQESLNTVIHAQDQFAALPALVRERFQNDPGQFLSFATDVKNIDEMVKMGLATYKPGQSPDELIAAKMVADEKLIKLRKKNEIPNE